jgi:predicted metal-dependent enzyme (double-stranded beta helix superfamily)
MHYTAMVWTGSVSTIADKEVRRMPGIAVSAQFGLPPAGLMIRAARKARFSSPLAAMLSDVACAAAGAIGCRDRDIAAALAPYMGLTGLLDGVACPGGPEKYTRHLLHAGAGYSVLALVWRPRQMSPVHAHRTWCVFGVHQGWMTETLFTRGATDARPFASMPRRAGDVAHAPADPDKIHRLANLGTTDALSIHVYGAAYDRLGHDVNEIWAE